MTDQFIRTFEMVAILSSSGLYSYPIASRKSPLALVQAELVAQMLARAAGVGRGEVAQGFPVTGYLSTGDKNLEGPLIDIGGKGLFTREIEAALLDGRARFAVHSLKDMPVEGPPGLVVAAIAPREDPRDGFISEGAQSPWDLPEGAIIGTASVRRRAQVLARRPDLQCHPLRGNVATRLAKLKSGAVAGTFLAVAGLNRLGLQGAITKAMDVREMLPAVGQGALCVQAREDDHEAIEFARRAIDCATTHDCVTIERAFLARLDGSCRSAIAGLARREGDYFYFDGEYLSVDGENRYTVHEKLPVVGESAEGARDQWAALGVRAAEQICRDRGFDRAGGDP